MGQSADGCKRDNQGGSDVSSTRNGHPTWGSLDEEQSNGKKKVQGENSFSVSQTSCQTKVMLKLQVISPWNLSTQDLLAFLQRGRLNLYRMSCRRSLGKGQPLSGSCCPPGEVKPSSGWTDARAGPGRALWHPGAARASRDRSGGGKSGVSFWEGLGRTSQIPS